jgi:hypothetical protein
MDELILTILSRNEQPLFDLLQQAAQTFPNEFSAFRFPLLLAHLKASI